LLLVVALDRSTVRPPPSSLVVTITLAALATLVAGGSLKVRLSGRPGSKPILPIAVARLAALGIATAITGALVAGGWAGLLVERLTKVSGNSAARHDVIIGALGLLSGVLLAVAGQRLQRLCRSPGGPYS
jgi:hypothetical protein